MTDDAQVTNNAQPRKSVFRTKDSRAKATGAVHCPQCGGQITYSVGQVGEQVACPACPGVKVRAGRSLLDEKQGLESKAHMDRPFAVLLVSQRRWKRTMATLLVLGLSIGMVIAAAWWMTAIVPVPSGGWLSWTRVGSREGKLPEGTRAGSGDTAPLSPPEITLQAINRLATWPDEQKALVQAQVWLQMLQDHEIADQRTERLMEIVVQLEEQLKKPDEPPPAFIGEFRLALQTARNALVAEDFEAAGRALAQAEALLNQHPDELAPYGRSFLAIKQRYEQMRMRHEGRDRIRDLLADAEQHLQREKPTAAAEAIAQAMFYALNTPLSDAEFQQRNETVRRLRRELQFARGKRAVEDAQRCHDQNDLAARDGQLQVAFDLLPHLSSNRVAPILERARQLAEEAIASPAESDLGRSLEFRAAYERALEFYGRRGGLIELATQCVEAHRLIEAAPQLGSESKKKVEDLMLVGLEFSVLDVLSLPVGSDEAAPRLAQAREALDVASVWKDTAKYRYVEQALVSKEDEIAKAAIQLAIRRAEGGGVNHLAAAIQTVESALSLGTPQSRQRASDLHRTWRSEHQRLVGLQLQQEAWSEMSAFSRESKYLEAWIGLAEFEQRFPTSPRIDEIAGIRRRLRSRVDKSVDQLEVELRQCFQDKNWPRFREIAEKVSQAPLGADQTERFDWTDDIVAQLNEQAETLYGKTKPLRRMLNDTEVAELLRILRTVRQLNPRHKDAEMLFTKANDKANGLAQGLMLQAKKSGPRNAGIFRRYLERIVALDPGGKLGTEAQELLEELEETNRRT